MSRGDVDDYEEMSLVGCINIRGCQGEMSTTTKRCLKLVILILGDVRGRCRRLPRDVFSWLY